MTTNDLSTLIYCVGIITLSIAALIIFEKYDK